MLRKKEAKLNRIFVVTNEPFLFCFLQYTMTGSYGGWTQPKKKKNEGMEISRDNLLWYIEDPHCLVSKDSTAKKNTQHKRRKAGNDGERKTNEAIGGYLALAACALASDPSSGVVSEADACSRRLSVFLAPPDDLFLRWPTAAYSMMGSPTLCISFFLNLKNHHILKRNAI
jgi:hypothetical protein